MAVIDDDVLGTLLHQAGEAFDVPAGGAEEILRRATAPESGGSAESRSAESSESSGSGPMPGPNQIAFPLGDDEVPTRSPRTPRTLRSTVAAHRLLAVAAAVIVLAGLTGGALLLGTSTPRTPERSVAALPGSAHGSGAGSGGAVAPSTTTTSPSTALGQAALPPSAAAGGSTGAAAQPDFNTSPSKASAPAQTPTNSSLPPGSVGQPARIEQTGSLDLRVAKGALNNTMTRLTALAGTYNGFVTNSQTQSSQRGPGGAPSASVTLQVPVASFSAVLKNAQSMGRTTDLTTKATDVTGQYVDLQCNDRVWDLSGQSHQPLPLYPNLRDLMNLGFFVETGCDRRAFLYLDSVLLSAAEEA